MSKAPSIQNIILTMSSENVFSFEMNEFRKMNPKVKFYKIGGENVHSNITIFELYEIGKQDD